MKRTGDQKTSILVGCGSAGGGRGREDGAAAARQALAGTEAQPLSAVIVFASVSYDLEALSEGIVDVVGDVPLLGATTAGEICDGPKEKSVVVVALASPHLEVHIGVGEEVARDWEGAVAKAVAAPGVGPFFAPDDNDAYQVLTRTGRSAFGLLFSPGNTKEADSRAYHILERLKSLSAGRLPIIGGCAADDWRMEANYVLHNRQVHVDSVLVAIFETSLRFGMALSHGFRPSQDRATVSRVEGQEVMELDGEPAAEVYARMLQSDRASLEGKHLTLTTGKPVGSPDPYGQYSINVASYFTKRQGVRLAQPVAEGTLLTVMEADRNHFFGAGRTALRKALIRGGG